MFYHVFIFTLILQSGESPKTNSLNPPQKNLNNVCNLYIKIFYISYSLYDINTIYI